MNQKTIDEFINQLDEIYTIPGVALKVIQLLTDPEVRISDLSNVIKTDPALAIDILKVANSGYFNFKEEVTTIQKAIVLLGLNLTKEISVSFAVKSLIKGMAEIKDINYNQFWMHAAYCGIFSKKIGEFLGIDSEALFISGLLHDLGVILEILFNPDLYASTFKKAIDKRVSYFLLEQEIDDFDHAQLGSRLLENWRIPAQIWVPIKYHHNVDGILEEDYKYAKEIYGLYLGNISTHLYKKDIDGYDGMITEKILQRIGMNRNSFEELFDKISSEIEDEKELISLLT